MFSREEDTEDGRAIMTSVKDTLLQGLSEEDIANRSVLNRSPSEIGQYCARLSTSITLLPSLPERSARVMHLGISNHGTINVLLVSSHLCNYQAYIKIAVLIANLLTLERIVETCTAF